MWGTTCIAAIPIHVKRLQERTAVTVTFHGNSKTFTRKTLKSMIEAEAHWTEDDLKRLKLIK
jgi:hypothetical protein